MNTNSGKTMTFRQIIKDFSIEIPIIQRDFAQGRSNTEEIRTSFLFSLFSALNDNKALDLDFIYGTISNNKFIPLDGQQRLTTLFLLHFYLASKDGCYDDFKNLIINEQGHSKFTYETRPSSKDFCEALVNNGMNLQNHIPSEIIKDAYWFYLSWNDDPTVQSMLTMLDSIHSKFNDSIGFYQKLIEENNSFITFCFLSLDDFNLTDDLYIKMNARGKLLTNFESFKARLEQYIQKNYLKIDITDWKQRIDVEWIDLFWRFKKENIFEIDNEYYNFFKVMILFFYIEQRDVKVEENKIISEDEQKIIDELLNNEIVSLSTFENSLSANGLNRAFKVLDYFGNNGENIVRESLKKSPINDALLLKLFSGENSNTNLWDKTYIYAFTIFLLVKDKKLADYESDDKNQLFCWMRVCKNFIYNTYIDNPGHLVNVIYQLNNLSQHCTDIYKYLSSENVEITYILPAQVEEERIKAKLILNDKYNGWEEEFIKHENHGYFYGQIGFLFEYSQIDGKYEFELFKKYAQKSTLLFSDDILRNENYILQRALLCKNNYLIKSGAKNMCLCKPDKSTLRNRNENWRIVFRDTDRSNILKDLLDSLSENIDITSVQNELQKIIDRFIDNCSSGTIKTDWRYHFIRNKNVVNYCQEKQIRWENENDIKLLKRKQLNGYHVELFTYSFYVNFIKEKEHLFKPFSKIYYMEIIGHDNPYIVFKLENDNYQYEMGIYFKSGDYHIIFSPDNNIEIIDNIEKVLSNLNFCRNTNYYEYYEYYVNDETSLLNLLNTLCKGLGQI